MTGFGVFQNDLFPHSLFHSFTFETIARGRQKRTKTEDIKRPLRSCVVSVRLLSVRSFVRAVVPFFH